MRSSPVNEVGKPMLYAYWVFWEKALDRLGTYLEQLTQKEEKDGGNNSMER